MTGRRPALCFVALIASVVAGLVLPATPAQAATVPAGFADVLVTPAPAPTALAFTPDGRMLVTAKTGQLFVVRNGVLAASPALDLSARVCTQMERGLLGVAVDPAFASNQFVYLYYTAQNAAGACPRLKAKWPVNRVVRVVLRANDSVDPASELVLFDGIPSVSGIHNAGDLAFGSDGMLYVSVGDSGCDYAAFENCDLDNDASRDPNVALGKILRINPVDGSAPADNPFSGPQPPCRDDGFTTAPNHCPETWASGFRNPFRFAIGPAGQLYANDVGEGSSEEVDDVRPGLDYGWNIREGTCVAGSTTNCPAPPTGITDPILAYGRDDGCSSITGGAFAPASWPEAYRGAYLFVDFECGKIFRLDGSTRVDFATGLDAGATHLLVGPDDALYYATFGGNGQIRMIAPLAPQAGGGFLSDRAWISAPNGFGPVELDRSSGEAAAGDGPPIRLNGVVSAKGLGVHASSIVTYALPPDVTSFSAQVGVDDDCGSDGSVVFRVLVDGKKRFDSGTMTGASATKSVVVDVTGGSLLELRATTAGDGQACDHADWAKARLA